MEIRIPNASRLPNPSVFFSSTVREWNQRAENTYGRVSFGRCVDHEGNILRGGLVLHETAHVTRNGTNYQVKLSALTGSPAARQSGSGRNGPWACWYAVRDFLTAVFDEYPDATVRTMLATYKGRDDFLEKFPRTYFHRVSEYGPKFGELCHNIGWHDQHDRD
jgi:hypothetical protein